MASPSNSLLDRREEEEEEMRSEASQTETRSTEPLDRVVAMLGTLTGAVTQIQRETERERERDRERQRETERERRETADRQANVMNRMMDRLEELEVIVQGERGRVVTFNNPPALEERRAVCSTAGLATGSRWTTSSVEEPERRWAASPFCPSVAPREVQAREGARAVEFPTPTIDDQDRDNDFYDAPNENRM